MQCEPHTAKLCLSVVFKHFWWNSPRIFLFRHKSDYRRTSTEILRNLFFLPCLTRGQILRKIWICLNNYFWSNQLKGININNNSFSPKRGPYTAKLSLSLFWSIFWEIHRELFFLIIKLTISETSTEILRRLFFNMFESGKSWEKFVFV